MENIGQRDGEQTWSEIHDRENRLFQSALSRVEAENAVTLSWAARNLAIAHLIRMLTFLLFCTFIVTVLFFENGIF